jgi:hypothetical protein
VNTDAWALLRRAPPLHLRTWDADILSAVLDEGGRHGHQMEVWHVAHAGQTAYATCTRCRFSAWRVQGRLTRFEVGVLHPCPGQESAEHERARMTLSP